MAKKFRLVILFLTSIPAVFYVLLYGRLLRGFIPDLNAKKEVRNSAEVAAAPMLSVEDLRTLEARLQIAQHKRKYILRWYGRNETEKKEWPSHICGNCELTNDRSLISHPDTGAVVFLYNQIDPLTMPPLSSRRIDQLHVWYTAEAPASLHNMRKQNLVYEDAYEFNISQTYRRDSGIFHPYGIISDILDTLEERGLKDADTILRHKTSLSVAVVSNCNATAGASVRLALIKRLIDRGLRVDTFGRCFGKGTISKSKPHELEGSLSKYKFFLAFENSYHCRDYITEKFFINGFRSGTVPVAWGAKREDYEAISPPHSFIFAEDYASLDDLVGYLKYLDQNDTAYLEYFRWHEAKKTATPKYAHAMRFCQLCRQVHGINVDDIYNPYHNQSQPERPLFTDAIAHRSIPSLRDWYYKTEHRICFESNRDALEKLVRIL